MASYRGSRGINNSQPPKKSKSNDFVDISSGASVRNVYNKKNKIIRLVSMILAVVFTVVGCGLCYVSAVMNSLGDDGTLESDTREYNVDDDKGTGVVTDAKLLNNKDVLNVVLFGQDNRESDSDTGRSDTMILVSVDAKHKQIKMTSFLRDTYVYIPSGDDFEGWNKLNASYSYGGVKLAVKTIESNFGIKVDRYGILDFSGFKEVIDALGGIVIPITGTEARYINAQIDYNNQKCKHIPDKYCESIPKTNSKGETVLDRHGNPAEKTKKVKLNGQQALWYARNRGSDEISTTEIFVGDDWDRTERQRKLIGALISEFKNASFTELVSIVDSIGPMITTNFKSNEIASLMTSALSILNYPMYQFHIPIGEDSDPNKLWQYNRNDYAGSYVEITDWDKTRSELADYVFNKADKKYLVNKSSKKNKSQQ